MIYIRTRLSMDEGLVMAAFKDGAQISGLYTASWDTINDYRHSTGAWIGHLLRAVIIDDCDRGLF